jgi:hypothetical protein
MLLPRAAAMRAFLGLLAFCLSVVPHANAIVAAVTSTISKKNNVIVTIVSEIAEGEADALKLVVKSANDSGRLVSKCLDSPGENVLEGSRIANLGRFGKIAATVASGAGTHRRKPAWDSRRRHFLLITLAELTRDRERAGKCQAPGSKVRPHCKEAAKLHFPARQRSVSAHHERYLHQLCE